MPCLLPHQLWSLVIPGHSRCGRSSFLTTLHCIMWWNNVAWASGNPVHPISIQTPPGSQKDLGPHVPCSAGLGEHSSQAPVMAGRLWTHCLSVQVGNKSLWKVTWRMSTPWNLSPNYGTWSERHAFEPQCLLLLAKLLLLNWFFGGNSMSLHWDPNMDQAWEIHVLYIFKETSLNVF